MSELKIKHRTERISGLVRSEIYELDDLVYTEQFDDISGQRLLGFITMYNNVRVCLVGEDGTLNVNIPTNWITNHNDMMDLIIDVQRLDAFISEVCDNYH